MSTLAARRPAFPPVEAADWAVGVSVCIPIGPGEAAWVALLADLRPLSAAGGRVICCGAGPRPEELPAEAEWATAPRANRAVQLNAAARACDGETLWFLHADSRLTAADLRAAVIQGRTLTRAVGYLRLAFDTDGPPLTRLNGWAANLRSRRFGMPFGDQGLMVSRSLWEELGGFDEAAPYGEGHLFAWAARRVGAPLIELPAAIVTSARKYRRGGWARTTATHLWLTARQAAPQWWAWVRGR
ncbi:glycosyl transferase family 2 [Alienimonas californiensis]|uniref:Glycosyl transferase family 2 n=1 Tax=Alienimonas californiensis TaxID=2527989 RepID=A0A517PEG6_9PLAN|nr:glycosyl transferase family 2 [Alienimonas californiensis]QDT17765.1 hypothetical protein CA12_38970 [Alienimonas californiensis]